MSRETGCATSEDFPRKIDALDRGGDLEDLEKHLQTIVDILCSEQALFFRLEMVGEYLIEVNDLSAVSIFRRVGDELDDHVFVSGKRGVSGKNPLVDPPSDNAEQLETVTVIPSRNPKQRLLKKTFDAIPEFIAPIIKITDVVGLIHAEKGVGGHFTPTEIMLLKETAGLISKYFFPAVLQVT